MNTMTDRFQARKILWAAFSLLLVLALVMPLAAQDDSETTDDLTDDDATIIVGVYGFNDEGDIIVTAEDGEVYIIAPAGAFNPSTVEEGDLVIIIGRELPDGETIQAIEFDFFVEDETPDPEATPEATPEVDPEATPEVVEEPVEEPSACESRNHPVANRIAEEFEVEPGEVMAMHCDGNGFGNIARAYLLGRELEMDPQSFLDAHKGGMGWGQIVNASGVHPSDLAPGRIGKGKHNDDDTSLESSNSRGNSGNRGNNGNNGNRGNNGNNGNRGNNGNNGGGKKK